MYLDMGVRMHNNFRHQEQFSKEVLSDENLKVLTNVMSPQQMRTYAKV
jgi:hypothetical protein